MTATKTAALMPGCVGICGRRPSSPPASARIAQCRTCGSPERCIPHSALCTLHLNVPLAEQPRQWSAKPQRLVQLQHGIPI